MGMLGGLFQTDKRQTTNTTVNTTTTNTSTTRDVGLTGKDAIALAEIAQAGSVALAQTSAQQSVSQFNTLNDTFRILQGYNEASNTRVNDTTLALASISATESGKQFSQLVGGANNLLDKADIFVDYSYQTAGDILDFTKDAQSKSYEFTGQTLDKSKDFATDNISKITEGAIRGAEFVTTTAKDIAGSIIPQTKELQQIALFLVGIVGVVTVATIWQRGK